MAFHFKLITPERVVDEREIEAVSLPTVDGEITVLNHHAPLTALLVPGVMKIRNGTTHEELSVSGGFIHIDEQGQVVVLADTAERGADLSITVIEQAKERAQQVMREAVKKDDVSFAAAAAGLERELARYKVAKKHHRERGLPLTEHANFFSSESSE